MFSRVAAGRAATGGIAAGVGAKVYCSEKDPPHHPPYPWWFQSIFHSHDIPSVRRGYEVYRQVCSTCHSMDQLRFRHLVNQVYPERRVKEIAASYDITDPDPNDEGESFTRPGILTDGFPSPYPNEEAARYANGGANPPDMSVYATAKHDGADFIMSLLTSYREPPCGVEVRPGTYYNTYFPGGIIGMPPPLENGLVEYEDGTPATVSQMAKDVSSFLVWASDPAHDERKMQGLKAFFACSLAILFCGIWQRSFWVGYKMRRVDFTKVKL